MAMLAEPRRKTKFVLTPKSKPLWTLESNGIQFGKKLMEKMGWNAGEGLGALGQGIQEPLRQAFKQDTKGMGYSGDGNPFENLDEFNALLASLTGEEPVANESQSFESLEEKSKRSKSRVHYKKFTRGKDLANYSKMDLTCIVGSGKKPKEEEPVEEEVIDGTGETENSHGVTTINSGSIAEYFKLKMDQKKLGGFVSEEKSCVENSEELSKEERKLRKKKRKCTQEDEEEVNAVTELEGETSVVAEDVKEDLGKEERKVKRKKQKRSHEKELEDNAEEQTKLVAEDVEEASTKEKKKKKKRKHSHEEIEQTVEQTAEGKKCDDEDPEEVFGDNMKKSKKKKEKSSVEDVELDVSVLEEVKEKKKKKRKTSCSGEIDDSVVQVHRKKCKKKDKEKDVDFEKKLIVDEREQENEIVNKKKKKRKTKDLEKDVSVEQGENSVEENETISEKYKKKSQETDDPNEEPRKKKKKDKKREKDENQVVTETEPPPQNTLQDETAADNIETDFVGANLNSLPGYGCNRRQYKH